MESKRSCLHIERMLKDYFNPMHVPVFSVTGEPDFNTGSSKISELFRTHIKSTSSKLRYPQNIHQKCTYPENKRSSLSYGFEFFHAFSAALKQLGVSLIAIGLDFQC